MATVALTLSAGFAHAEKTNTEAAGNAIKQGWVNTKQSARDLKAEIICKADDKKCLEAKAKAEAKNAKDEIEIKAEKIKDQID